MYQQYYYIPKESGTLMDTLLAFGAAKVLEEIVRRSINNANVAVHDAGHCYMLDAGVTIQENWINALPPFEQIDFLTSSKVELPADLAGMAIRNIDAEWEHFRQYQEQRKQLSDHKVVGEELEQALADLKPKPDWTVVTYLGDYRMQAQAIHNDLVEQWRRTSEKFLGLNLRTILAMFASLNVDRDALAAQWKKATKGADFSDTVTASQLFNPHMGKGQNRPKSNGLAMGNEKNFWLLDYLKAVGLWEAAAPRNAQNADLRKTYILAPRRIALNAHRTIFNEFRNRLWNNTSIKMDIMAALLYTDELLKYSIEGDNLGIFDDGPVQDLIAGMNVATYQLLSQNSYTMMNLSFLGLPNWMPQITSFRDAQEFRDILQEHIERISGIDEEKSEGHALLLCYRDFVSSNDFCRFFDFCTGYAGYLMSELERNHFYVKPFSEHNLRRLIEMTNPKLTPILQSQGFRNIAEAIRRSTVIPQYLGRKTSRFDIRYGLGSDLKRQANYPDDFIQALADFMQSYNEENARVAERTKGQARRAAITTEDIADIVRLIDEYDPKTICNLLVAFGYARDPKVKEDEETTLVGE
ncbi:MAG: hypothetical protein U0350_34440 [Caldilineaceae bacterium]